MPSGGGPLLAIAATVASCDACVACRHVWGLVGSRVWDLLLDLISGVAGGRWLAIAGVVAIVGGDLWRSLATLEVPGGGGGRY